MAAEYEYDDGAGDGRVLWGRLAVLLLALLLVFVLGRCTAGDDGAADEQLQSLEEEVETLRSQRDALQAEIDAMEAGGTDPEPDEGDDGDGDDGDGDGDDGQDGGDGQDGDGDDGDDGGDGDDGDNGDDGDARTHEVTESDTLYTIAQEYYGDGSKFTLITEANNLSRDDPLRVGQVLEIPPES
ncbi:MAG: LysM peptidoglycan-binding domain-containing protein [Egibacteraceae bacterium]